MLRTIIAGLLIFTFSSAYADPGVLQIVPVQRTVILPDKQDNVLNKEVKDAIYYLQTFVKAEDQNFVKFFSTHGVPEKQRETLVLECSFVLHSLMGTSSNDESNAGAYYPLAVKDEEGFKPLRLVKGSKTLWWFDLREFNFTEDAWEKVSVLDPYFVEPVVHHPENSLLRLLSGNAVVRMDWFVYHATDIQQELDAGRKTKIYQTLLYASNKEPKNVDEFRKVWGLPDINVSRQLGNEYSALVTKSKNVARHNRLLFGYRTELGWLYQSYDTFSQEGKRDYLESVYEFNGKPPPLGVFDAGEMFATNQVRMQVYTLYNDKLDLIDFADARVARHLRDVTGNAVVRVAHSCMDCHSAGPIPPENTVREFLDARMKLYVPKKGDSLRIERSLLSKRFEDTVVHDQLLFAESLLKINGLTPADNVKNYLQVIGYYDQALDLTTVAYECGVTPEVVKEAAARGLQNINNKVPARVALLLATNESIPRDIWDSPGRDGTPGLFQQTMAMIYGLTVVQTTTRNDIVVDTLVNDGYVVLNNCNVMIGPEIRGTLTKEDILTSEMLGERTTVAGIEWVRVNRGAVSGWIQVSNIQKR